MMFSHVVKKVFGSDRFYFSTLGAILIMNLLDAIFTLVWVEGGFTEELNPIMVEALSLGPVAFMMLKLSLVSLAVWLLWNRRQKKIARILVLPLALVYCSVVGIHLCMVAHAIL
tara:strand:- start:65 stop:406 length:342 start_codon:yes stop_codon:yes gene_type:complete